VVVRRSVDWLNRNTDFVRALRIANRMSRLVTYMKDRELESYSLFRRFNELWFRFLRMQDKLIEWQTKLVDLSNAADKVIHSRTNILGTRNKIINLTNPYSFTGNVKFTYSFSLYILPKKSYFLCR
jgi:hypothetical protein